MMQRIDVFKVVDGQTDGHATIARPANASLLKLAAKRKKHRSVPWRVLMLLE
jgi:hypothetical protein